MKQFFGKYKFNILAWAVLLYSLASYHDTMTRLAQEGYVEGYVEGMVQTAKKSDMIGAYSEEERNRISTFLKSQSEGYLQIYREHGGAF